MARPTDNWTRCSTKWQGDGQKNGVLCRWSVPDRSIALPVAFALVMWYTEPELIAAMVSCAIKGVARWGVHILF